MTYNAHIYGKYGQLPYKSVAKVANICDKERLIAFMLIWLYIHNVFLLNGFPGANVIPRSPHESLVSLFFAVEICCNVYLIVRRETSLEQ